MNTIYLMIFLTAFDSIVMLIALYVMFKWYKEKYVIRRLGIALLFLGCVYQALKSGYYVISGHLLLYTDYVDYPLWMMKDIGFGVLLLGYIIEKRKGRK